VMPMGLLARHDTQAYSNAAEWLRTPLFRIWQGYCSCYGGSCYRQNQPHLAWQASRTYGG
jgi:hypothetical protein